MIEQKAKEELESFKFPSHAVPYGIILMLMLKSSSQGMDEQMATRLFIIKDCGKQFAHMKLSQIPQIRVHWNPGEGQWSKPYMCR